jgi:transcription initiation factor TFIIIB Brf1 subunit/transcription initiation factor TFIIB
MTEFDLFNEAFEKYSKINSEKDPSEIQISEVSICQHKNITEEKSTNICLDCGEELGIKLVSDKEWRYFGYSGSKHLPDAERKGRKSQDCNIFKDVENLNFSDNIINKANEIYNQVTNGKIYRGNSRKATVFACVFFAYNITGNPQNHDNLIKIFNINKNIALKGLKFVTINATKESNIRNIHITPLNLAEEIMKKLNAKEEHIKEVFDLYEKIKNRSSKLNRSRPLSVGAGIVFYWICLKNKNITLEEFAKQVKLSELTISKVLKEIKEIIEKI